MSFADKTQLGLRKTAKTAREYRRASPKNLQDGSLGRETGEGRLRDNSKDQKRGAAGAKPAATIQIPGSAGELIDKITIWRSRKSASRSRQNSPMSAMSLPF